MKTLNQLRTEFGDRICTLNNGQPGLRGGLCCRVRDVGDESDPVMDFIATDETIDRYNECIKIDGWQLDNFRANPVIPDCHDYSSISRILGRADSVNITGGKMINRVRFCTDNPMGNLAYKMAKGGFIKSQSVGFIPLEWTNGNDKDQPDRTYTKCELLEISLVVVPANPSATIGMALKQGVIDRRDLRDVIDHLEHFCSNDPADHGAKAGASGTGVIDARLLQIARTATRAEHKMQRKSEIRFHGEPSGADLFKGSDAPAKDFMALLREWS